MPGEKTETQTGSTQQSSGGMFDGLAGAPEATRDEANAETNVEDNASLSNASETSQEQTETATEVEKEVGQEPKLDEQGNPIVEPVKEPVKETFEINGRTFASKDELVTAYKNSSSEGIRLAKQHEEDWHQLNELSAKLLELEDAQQAMAFPELLSTDKDQEEAQLEMLPQHKQTEYILNKREWEKKQLGLKEANAQKRKQLETNKAEVKALIERNDQDMASKPEEFPSYKELKPTMAKIVELTPALANRPETPYISFWIAYGLNAFNKAKATKAEVNKTATATKDKAAAAQTQVGKSGIGKSGTATASGGSSIAQAWKDRNGSVI